jgi:uncharacterized Ntn-hydrolase superfamily protein
MIRHKLVIPVVLVTFAIVLGGCATTRKQSDLEIQGLRNQVSVLQTQLQSKDDEINALKESLNKLREQKPTQERTTVHKRVVETKERPTAKQIQVALKNAGYYTGIVDGKIGKQTRKAIKAFQKANNLRVNGRAGKQTWNLLKEYLEKTVK